MSCVAAPVAAPSDDAKDEEHQKGDEDEQRRLEQKRSFPHARPPGPDLRASILVEMP